MLKTLTEKVAPENAAIIVVDVQNDFIHDNGASARNGRDVAMAQAMVPTLAKLLDEGRRAGVPVVWVRMAQTEHTKSEVHQEHRLRRGTEVSVCEEGTWGVEFYEVGPLPGEAIITKHRYSAFIGTDLNLVLRSKGVKSLIVTGVATNVCVESTARDGYMLDYYIVFAGDCSACSAGPQAHEETLANIERTFGIVASADEIIGNWGRVAVGV